MSYAGPARSRHEQHSATRHTASRSMDHEPDWQQVAVFGAGLALGVALGAGIALLSAPQEGWKTRDDLRRFARGKRRSLQRKTRDAWRDLRDELRDAARELRRSDPEP